LRIRILAVVALWVGLTGCSSFEQVNQGWQGATSPAESGQHGSAADQAAAMAKDKAEHEIKPIRREFTNGNTDPTMEGSGNMAAQGDYAHAAQQRLATR
jgi:hypothetical protein